MSVVALPDETVKNGNIGAQLQSLGYTTATKIFRKIIFLYDFGAHKLFRSEPCFWTT